MKQVLHTEKAPAAIGPYAQGWKVGDMVYTSGQLGIDMETGKLAEGVEAQARASMRNVGEILKAAGASYGDVVKTTIFLKDMGDFAEVNAAYGKFFTENPPARACVQVAKLPRDARIEIEVIAAKEG